MGGSLNKNDRIRKKCKPALKSFFIRLYSESESKNLTDYLALRIYLHLHSHTEWYSEVQHSTRNFVVVGIMQTYFFSTYSNVSIGVHVFSFGLSKLLLLFFTSHFFFVSLNKFTYDCDWFSVAERIECKRKNDFKFYVWKEWYKSEIEWLVIDSCVFCGTFRKKMRKILVTRKRNY